MRTYMYPKVIELREPQPKVGVRRAASQRALVAASLVRCPDPAKRSASR